MTGEHVAIKVIRKAGRAVRESRAMDGATRPRRAGARLTPVPSLAWPAVELAILAKVRPPVAFRGLP